MWNKIIWENKIIRQSSATILLQIPFHTFHQHINEAKVCLTYVRVLFKPQHMEHPTCVGLNIVLFDILLLSSFKEKVLRLIRHSVKDPENTRLLTFSFEHVVGSLLICTFQSKQESDTYNISQWMSHARASNRKYKFSHPTFIKVILPLSTENK